MRLAVNVYKRVRRAKASTDLASIHREVRAYLCEQTVVLRGRESHERIFHCLTVQSTDSFLGRRSCFLFFFLVLALGLTLPVLLAFC